MVVEVYLTNQIKNQYKLNKLKVIVLFIFKKFNSLDYLAHNQINKLSQQQLLDRYLVQVKHQHHFWLLQI